MDEATGSQSVWTIAGKRGRVMGGISHEQDTGEKRTVFSTRPQSLPTYFPSPLSNSLEQAKATGKWKQKRCSPFVTVPHS